MQRSTSSLAVVGASYRTARGAERRDEITHCRPGDVVELRREHGGRDGRRAIGVYSPRGVQIGYLRPEDAGEVGGLIAVARAVFQAADTFGAVIRVTLDGSAPTLPLHPPRRSRPAAAPDPEDEFCDIL